MPDGATVIEKDGNKGIVIKDKNNNEWTWVEVPKNIYTNTTYNGGTAPTNSENYTKIASVMENYASAYRESGFTDTWYSGCGISDAATYTAIYNKMLKSTYENGGFWIARYEAGIAGSNASEVATGRTASSKGNISTKAVIQKDMIPYDYVKVSEAQTLASNMSPDSSKTSSLIFGIQWDLTCKYLEEKSELNESDINSNSTSWGNYPNLSLTLISGKYAIYDANENEYALWKAYSIKTDDYVEENIKLAKTVYLTTGASSTTSVLNISDFAGNAWECTLEYTGGSDKPLSVRGGGCYWSGSDYPSSFRATNKTSDSIYAGTFRVVLY